MALPWLPCSQRRPLVARISPKPAAASRLFWLGRDCHVERRAAAAHRQIAMFVGVGAHFDARSGGILGRTPAAQIARGPEAVCDSLVRRARRRQRRGVAARAASALPTHGSAGGQHYRCLCASRGRSSPDRLSLGGGGGRRALTCVCGWTTLEGDGEAAATAAASSARCARITSPAAPTRASGSALAARRLPEGREPPDPSRPLCGGAAALARRRRCCLASRDVLSGIARRRLLYGNVAVCSATRRCGGSALPLSRRPASGPGNTSAVGGARSARPCRRVLPIAPRPSPRRLPLPRRQLGERRWRSLRRTPWSHARPVGVPEAMCG
jgi:hypothetical protein